MHFLQHAIVLTMLAIEIGVGVLLQIAADDGLRFVPFGDAHGFDTRFGSDPGVQADEVDEIGTEQQQLRHDGIVVIFRRQMTVGTGLGLGFACRVRKVRCEGLRAETAGGDRRLLDINTFATRIGR